MQRISNPRTLLLVIVLVVALAVTGYLLRDPEAEQADLTEEIAPHPIKLGPLRISSTVVNTWAMMLILGGGAYLVGRTLKVRPGLVQNALEWLVEAIEGLIRENVGTEDTSIFLPVVGT